MILFSSRAAFMWSAFQQSILGKPSKHFMAPGLMVNERCIYSRLIRIAAIFSPFKPVLPLQVSWWRSSIYVWIATTSVSHKPWTTARPSSPPAPAWTACLAWTSDPAHWVSLEAQANGHHHPLCSLFCYIRGSYILFTRENHVQELLQLGDLWHPVSLSAICKQWCFNLWAAVFFFFFSVLRYQGKQGRCTHWHETGGERVAWSGGNFLERWMTRSLSFSCLVQVDTNFHFHLFLMYFLLFLINCLYGLKDKNGFQF